jgi:arabinose-5-phosphate isomerase
MISGDSVPRVKLSTPLKDVIIEITSKRLGATCVVGEDGKLKGVVTDGDLRRMLQKTTDVANLTAESVMTKNPKVIRDHSLAAIAIQEMESFNITQLIVVDGSYKPVGMVHLHDLVKAGLSNEVEE